ncbi:FAD-dependent monooxygenase [Rhodococcus qingshengii]|uniref:FAD-dependent monooxygenase n=1 Tax=Rhodococcus qingshengii TaxID=334542 RepID=UPI001BE99B32|nr:FAD-dependent monooxygenase [Rhodococcus qingshengii]MBT2276302.1 FAD-dependent monooxygenase [Rhodococcus qingshengii]
MTHNSSRRALVVGMGISGIATAARLHTAGWSPVIVERSAERRRGGYFVALFRAGRIAADHLGMSEHLHDRQSSAGGFVLDRKGGKRPGMSYADVPGQPWLMLRSDVEAAAHAVLPTEVEVRFATSPTAITPDCDGVDVTLENVETGAFTSERFDLVVGCDGLRSTVRRLVFGPHENYLVRLDHMIAAFEYSGASLPVLEPGESGSLQEPGRSMMVFGFKDHDPTILMNYRTDDVDAEFTSPPAERLRAAFGPSAPGPALEAALSAADTSDTLLFDSAEQVHMKTWRHGRVVLVGDAAWCTTLYAGMGVSAGLVGADLLGAMLERHSDPESALSEWESTLRPYIAEYQQMGQRQRSFFVQDNLLELTIMRLVPKIAKLPLTDRLVARFKPNSSFATDADVVGIATRLAPHPARST